MRRTYVLAALLSATVAVGIGSAGYAVDSALAAQSVSLADATVPPSELTMLYPHASVTYAAEVDAYNCPKVNGWFTDVSAYRWNGSALGPQQWNADHTVTSWKGYRGRVTFDGITFRNHTHARVLVAGWCDS